jgi:hypothetical protein
MNECPLCGQEYEQLVYDGVTKSLSVNHGDDIVCMRQPCDIEGRFV